MLTKAGAVIYLDVVLLTAVYQPKRLLFLDQDERMDHGN